MSKYNFVLNTAGVGELLRSNEMAQVMTDFAQQVQARAGEGYAVDTPHDTGQRMAVNVYAETYEAKKDNLANNTLLKSAGVSG